MTRSRQRSSNKLHQDLITFHIDASLSCNAFSLITMTSLFRFIVEQDCIDYACAWGPSADSWHSKPVQYPSLAIINLCCESYKGGSNNTMKWHASLQLRIITYCDTTLPYTVRLFQCASLVGFDGTCSIYVVIDPAIAYLPVTGIQCHCIHAYRVLPQRHA